MIRYFVSFTTNNGIGIGFGNCEIDRHQPIRTMDDVAAVADILARQGVVNPTVMSFSRFDDPAGSGDAR